ncbi:hypothetical protein PG999_001972 [Apiospora kogelbergensis]|uniref:Uncharacterized protein n=1 Tax=Apiospora kogelbergensis TaxID=1337665 RepID=A0AAW0R6T4_9PEZI
MNRTAAAARLRRTFAYPADDDDASAHDDLAQEALDEQEQEELIESLAAQNRARNSQFRIFLLALPILSTVPYLISLVQPGKLNTLVAMLALTSLGSTAWMLHALPPGETGIPALDRWVKGISGQSSGGNAKRGMDSSTSAMLGVMQRKSPLETFMPYLNAGLCCVLILTGFVSKAHAPQQWGHVGLGNLPAVVYAVVLLAKMVMGSVDPEGELGALKYDYKGA